MSLFPCNKSSDSEFIAAFEAVAVELVKRAATDPAVSEDGVQQALLEIWSGPRARYFDVNGRVDTRRLRRTAVLRAKSRMIDERRKARSVSLDETVAAEGEPCTDEFVAGDDCTASRLDDTRALRHLAQRMPSASDGVRKGIQAIGLREAGYRDDEIASLLQVSPANVRQLVHRARAWARADPPPDMQEDYPGWPH